MSTAASAPSEEVLEGRCYTKARRHPSVVGRWPRGGRIPGGPYSAQQIAVAVGVFGALFVTRFVWAVFGLGNYAVLIVVPLVAGFFSGRVQIDGRSLVAVAASVAGLACRPRGGRQGGRPVKSRARRRLVQGACTLGAGCRGGPAAAGDVVEEAAGDAWRETRQPVAARLPGPVGAAAGEGELPPAGGSVVGSAAPVGREDAGVGSAEERGEEFVAVSGPRVRSSAASLLARRTEGRG